MNFRWSARARFAREISERERWPKRWAVYALAFVLGPLS